MTCSPCVATANVQPTTASPLVNLLPLLLFFAGCGSCWAFATAASTEAASFAQTGMVVSLAEKQLVDCNRENNGCNGGNFPAAFDYIIQNGLTTSTNYPYVSCL